MNNLDLVDIDKILKYIELEEDKKIFQLNVKNGNLDNLIYVIYNKSVYILKSLRYGYKNKVVFNLIGKNNITKSVYDVDIYQRQIIFKYLGLIKDNCNKVIQCENQSILY